MLVIIRENDGKVMGEWTDEQEMNALARLEYLQENSEPTTIYKIKKS